MSNPLAGFEHADDPAPRQLLVFPDVAKIAAIVAVVIVHVAAPTNEGFGVLGNTTWIASTVIETATRWCVPLFVMVSGMLLLSERTTAMTVQQFYRRRASRVAIPLIVWIVVYRAFQEYTGPHSTLLENAQAIWVGQPYYHLYFLFIIVGLYLVCPFIARVVVDLPDRQLRNVAITTLAFGFASGGLPPWLAGTGANALTMWIPFVGYFVSGCYLARVAVTRRIAVVAGASYVAVLAASASVTYAWVSARGLQEGRLLYWYLSPPVMMMTICVFLLLRRGCARWDSVPSGTEGAVGRRWLHLAGEATFGVYLIHPIFFTLWQRQPPGVPRTGHELALWLPLTVAGLLLVSFVCTVIMQRVPLVRRLV